jgi:hypothetical protein
VKENIYPLDSSTLVQAFIPLYSPLTDSVSEYRKHRLR